MVGGSTTNQLCSIGFSVQDHAEDLPAAPLGGAARENDAYDGRQDVVDGHRVTWTTCCEHVGK